MPDAPDSLGSAGPPPVGGGSETGMTEGKPTTTGTEVDAPPEFDRVADVLGPLEQIVLAADQKLGSIQQQVASQAGDSTADVERRVRESALEQRQKVAQLRGELTERVTELAGRFDALLGVLDEADRELAGWAGEPTDVSVTVTERQRVQLSPQAPPGVAPGSPPGAPPGLTTPGVPVDDKAAKRAAKKAEREAIKVEKEAAKQAKAGKSPSMADQSPIVKSVRKLFGRSKDSSA
jgi:hypothetical protein